MSVLARLDEIRARLAAATPGPWEHDRDGGGIWTPDRDPVVFNDYRHAYTGQPEYRQQSACADRAKLLALVDRMLDRVASARAHLIIGAPGALEEWTIVLESSETMLSWIGGHKITPGDTLRIYRKRAGGGGA